MSFVTIHPVSWMLVIALLLLDYARIALQVKNNCTTDSCEMEQDLFLYIWLGVANVLYSLLLYVVSRIYVSRLLSQNGLESSQDQSPFIQLMEIARFDDELTGTGYCRNYLALTAQENSVTLIVT